VTFLMMLASRFIFRKYGWGVAALITPTVLLITGVAFFSLVQPEPDAAHGGRARRRCAERVLQVFQVLAV
jgi:ATP/ADP translocase